METPSSKDKNGQPLHLKDWVQIVELPSGLQNNGDMQTLTLFERCLEGIFQIESFHETNLIELAVWKQLDLPGMDSIWIETEFVVKVESPV